MGNQIFSLMERLPWPQDEFAASKQTETRRYGALTHLQPVILGTLTNLNINMERPLSGK